MLNLSLEEAYTTDTSPIPPKLYGPVTELTSVINYREAIKSVIIKDLSVIE
jgi:hypothetical protein